MPSRIFEAQMRWPRSCPPQLLRGPLTVGPEQPTLGRSLRVVPQCSKLQREFEVVETRVELYGSRLVPTVTPPQQVQAVRCRDLVAIAHLHARPCTEDPRAMYMNTCAPAYLRIWIATCMHTYVHTFMCAYMHTWTYSSLCFSVLSPYLSLCLCLCLEINTLRRSYCQLPG